MMQLRCRPPMSFQRQIDHVMETCFWSTKLMNQKIPLTILYLKLISASPEVPFRTWKLLGNKPSSRKSPAFDARQILQIRRISSKHDCYESSRDGPCKSLRLVKGQSPHA